MTTWEVIHGDCRGIISSIGRVDAVITDPPYGVAFKSNRAGDRFRKIENDDAPFVEWMPLVDCGAMVVFHRWDVAEAFRVAMPMPIRSQVIWSKGGGGIGDLGRSFCAAHEPAYFATEDEWRWHGGRPGTSVVHIPKVPPEQMVHPTQKPVALMRWLVEWIVPPGGTVLDPFAGSGATGEACAATGRNFIGIEIDEEYVEIARRRIGAAAAQGRLFAEAAS